LLFFGLNFCQNSNINSPVSVIFSEALGQLIHRNIARFAPLMWHVEKNALHLGGQSSRYRLPKWGLGGGGRACERSDYHAPAPIFEDDGQSFGRREQEEEQDEQTLDDTKIPEMLTHPYR